MNTFLKYLKSVVMSDISIEDGMIQLIDRCEEDVRADVWKSIRALDFGGDAANVCRWLTSVLLAEPPANQIRAFWFGLFNQVIEDGRTSCGFYVSGSVNFDPDDETGDWACWTSESYLPKKTICTVKSAKRYI